MSDELSIQGALEETTLADLFRSLARNGETAVITVEAANRHDSIYFRSGKIVFAVSSDPDLGLAEVLLRGGELSLERYQRATENVGGAQRIGSVLVELGYLQSDELMRALERQVKMVVVSALALRTGSYTIEFTTQFNRDIPGLPINTERLLLDGVQTIESWTLISRGIGAMTRTLRKSEAGAVRSYNLDFTEDESYIYDLLSEPQSLASILQRSYLSDFATCRTLWALLAAGLLEEGEAAHGAKRRSAAADEMELESKVERYNGAFQAIFALVFEKIGDHSFDFVDRVARHLSPGMLPYLSGISLLNEGRLDFDQLLNNLISSGSDDQAAIVETLLDELLCGWILEIRAEFGAELDEPIAVVVESLGV
ncbi:MAG: DUF4388 domain-containing protein [Thermoanaerobaculia bacterium]